MPFGSSSDVVETLSGEFPQAPKDDRKFASDDDSLNTQGRPERQLAAWGDFAQLTGPIGGQDGAASSSLLETVRQTLRSNYVFFPLLSTAHAGSAASRIISRLLLAWTVALLTVLSLTLLLDEFEKVLSLIIASVTAWLVLSIETLWQSVRKSESDTARATGDELILIEACAWDEASEVSFDSYDASFGGVGASRTTSNHQSSPSGAHIRCAEASTALSPNGASVARTFGNSPCPTDNGLQVSKLPRSMSESSDAVSTASSSIRFGPPSEASSSSLCQSRRIDRGKSGKSMASIVSVSTQERTEGKPKHAIAWTDEVSPEASSRKPVEKREGKGAVSTAGDQRLDFEEIALTIAALDEKTGRTWPPATLTWAACLLIDIIVVVLMIVHSDPLTPDLQDIIIFATLSWLIAVVILDFFGLALIAASRKFLPKSWPKSRKQREKTRSGGSIQPHLQAVVPSFQKDELVVQALEV